MAKVRTVPVARKELRVSLGTATIERLEAYCLRRASRPPFRDLKPSAVARMAVEYYLEQVDAAEGRTTRRVKPPCAFARGAGGLAWCPEHDERWQIGGEVPETCRGDDEA